PTDALRARESGTVGRHAARGCSVGASRSSRILDPMHAHDHSPATTHASAVDAHGHSSADPDFGWWLTATVIFLAVLAGVFVLPATHAAGPVTPERPLAPEPGEGGNFAERLSEVQAQRNVPIAPTQEELDRQRAAALYTALAGGGTADD